MYTGHIYLYCISKFHFLLSDCWAVFQSRTCVSVAFDKICSNAVGISVLFSIIALKCAGSLRILKQKQNKKKITYFLNTFRPSNCTLLNGVDEDQMPQNARYDLDF